MRTDEEKRASTDRRFHSKLRVDRRTGCWIWTGAIRNMGRSPRGNMLNAMNGKVEDSAKVSLHLHRPGIDLRGKQVVHTCGDTLCVNPAHLDTVEYGQGYARGESHPLAKLDSETVMKLKRVHAYNRGRVSLREIGKRYGVSYETIRKIAMGYSSLLPAEQINEIRRLYKPHIKPTSVVPRGCNVAKQTLNKAAAGGTWRDVTA